MTRRHYTTLPAISGKQLLRLLEKDGWTVGKDATHICVSKKVEDRVRVSTVPNTAESLPAGTLQAILGPKQTAIGRKRLLVLLNAHGLK